MASRLRGGGRCRLPHPLVVVHAKRRDFALRTDRLSTATAQTRHPARSGPDPIVLALHLWWRGNQQSAGARPRRRAAVQRASACCRYDGRRIGAFALAQCDVKPNDQLDSEKRGITASG